MLGIIGAGNMANAIIAGLIKQDHPPSEIIVSDLKQSALDAIKSKFNVNIVKDNTALCLKSETLLLAMKPQQLLEVCNEIRSVMKDQLIISIAAGISTTFLNQHLGNNLAVVRAMPNLAAQIQSSISVLFANKFVNLSQRQLTEKLFQAIGTCLWVKVEDKLHTVTALSGSGPSYFFYMMEAMIQQGIALGLDEAMSKELVATTCLGASQIILKKEDADLSTLIQQVSSKGGTTEAAMQSLAKNDFDTIVREAVLSAHNRSIELSGET